MITAAAALPEFAGREGIDLQASALRTIRLAVIIRPADCNKLGMRFLIRHTRNGAQGERPCGCGKEEVLRHAKHQIRYLTASKIVPSASIVNAKSIVYDAFGDGFW